VSSNGPSPVQEFFRTLPSYRKTGDWEAADCPSCGGQGLLTLQGTTLRCVQCTDMELAEYLHAAPAASSRPWRSTPWSVFRDTAPENHQWLVDGLLPAGVLCFIAGAPKRGKTWLGIGLALALCLGKPFAEDHPVPEARHVLYIALEGSQTGLRTRVGALARGAGANPDSQALERLHMLYRPRPFNLSDIATSDWLLEETIDVDAALVFVDVLRAAAKFQENAAEDFARIRDHLEPLLAAGRTVALLHHFGKLTDTQKERSPGERMAGTGAMYGALDVGFLITSSDDGARKLGVTVEARDFAAPDQLRLAIKGEGHGKHGGLTYTDHAQLVIDTVAEIDYIAELETLFADDVWRGGDELSAALGRHRTAIETAIEEDKTRRGALGETPRIVRWDRDGRELGKAWNARPWGTYQMFEKARTSPGPSQPSLYAEASSKGSDPSTEGVRASEPFDSLGQSRPSPYLDDPLEDDLF